MSGWYLSPERTIVVLSVVGLVLSALIFVDLQSEYRERIEAASSKTQSLTLVLAEHERQTMLRLERILRQAAVNLSGAVNAGSADPVLMQLQLRLLLPLDGLISELTVIDASGKVVLSTAAIAVQERPSESERDYFVQHQGSPDHGLVLGAAFKQPETGKWHTPASIRRETPEGGFDGVILATIDPAFFQKFFDAIDTGKNGFITLFNRQGWVLARSPFIGGLFERSWENSPMFKEHLPGASDKTVRQVIAADGVERIYTYRALRDFPVIVAVGVSLTDSLAPWRSRAMAEGIALFLVLCALAAATCTLLRQLGQRRLTEQALKLVEMSIQKASVATLWIGPVGEILRVNPAACELEGYTEEQLLNMTVSDLDPGFPAERWPAHWQELRSLKKMSFETTHVGADGHRFPVEVDLHWIGFEGQEYNFAFIRDISAAKKTEGLLESERRRMQNIIHGANVGTWEINYLTQESWFDERWAAMIGYPADELLPMNGKKFSSMIHPDDVRLVNSQMLAHVMGSAPHVECEFRMKHKDAHWVWILSHGAVSAWTAKGKPEWISGTHLDISQRKAYEQSLNEARDKAEQATKSKSEFLANMSHEIRTPMNAILGMLKLLHNTELSTRQLDYASKTERAAQSLLGLLNDILDFSKIDADKMALDPQPFKLDRVMRDLSVILSANVDHKPLEVLFDIDPATPKNLVGDWLRLQQVLLNLSSNAIKFTDQGEVVIQVKVIDHSAGSATLRFAVRDSDSGIGIAPEHQKHIFDAFSQAEASTTRRFGGTGLGLSISRRLVEMMGGELALDSVQGKGSTFHFAITLPVNEQLSHGEEAPAPQPLKSLDVLVVDDNLVARELLAGMATSLGWRVEVAANGAQALALVDQRVKATLPPFEVIFMDWEMPGMDGWETYAAMHKIGPEARSPIRVMVTSHGREWLEQRTQQEQSSLHSFLVKPITASMLLDAVADARAGLSNLRSHPRTEADKPKRLQGLRLLVIEDNLINQQVASELLSAEGALVQLAGNGRLGVDAVAQASPSFDAVLMDIQMPVMDGYDATRAIRHELGLSTLPVIAMTANAMATDREACLAAGMNDHVGKPFDLTNLVNVLLKHTGRNKQGPASSETSAEALSPIGAETTVDAADTLPKPDAVDTEGALERIGGNKALYARILKSYLDDIAALPDQLDAQMQVGDRTSATRLLHTVKGLSATVGASFLTAVARIAERSVANSSNNFPDKALADRFRAAVNATGQVMRQVADDLAQGAPVDKQPAQVSGRDLGSLLSDLQKLRVLLKNSDMSAIEAHQQLTAALAETHRGLFKDLDLAMTSFDFAAGATQCETLIQTLTPAKT